MRKGDDLAEILGEKLGASALLLRGLQKE